MAHPIDTTAVATPSSTCAMAISPDSHRRERKSANRAAPARNSPRVSEPDPFTKATS